VWLWSDSHGREEEPVTGGYEHGNESSDSIKDGIS
jgi:hypothetical protein